MDLAQLAAVASRVGTSAETYAAGARLSVGTRLLLPLLQASTTMPTELAADLRAAIAGRDTVTLLLPAAAGNAAARLDTGTRQFALPAALRDAVLAALEAGAQRAAPATTAAATATASTMGAAATATAGAPAPAATDVARSWAVAAQTTAAAALTVSGSGAPRAVARARDDAPPPALRFSPPLFEPINAVAPVEAAAGRLRAAIERSGLFFESHVAQWAQGGRDPAELRAEALRLSAPETPAAQADERAAQRVAAQVALLQDGVLRLEGEAWAGQLLRFAVQREGDDADDGDAAAEPVFVATMAFDLPQLGPVDVALRLAGSAVSATVASADAEALTGALDALAEQFLARGLRPVRLLSVAAERA